MPKTKPSTLLELNSPWLWESGVIRTFATEGLSSDEVLRQICTDTATRPYIVETKEERRLHFTSEATQSIMLLEDPDALVSGYTRKMMAFLLFNANPREILMIGLGGGSLAKFCHRHLPDARITVVEINEDIIALRDQFCVPQDDARFQVIQADGARYMERCTQKFDVILVDAFDANGIATSLPQSNFYLRAARSLTRTGVLVMNFSGRGERYVGNILAIREAFRDHVMLVPVQSDGNLLLFARGRAFPQSITAELERTARRLQLRFQLEFPEYLRRICQGHTLAET